MTTCFIIASILTKKPTASYRKGNWHGDSKLLHSFDIKKGFKKPNLWFALLVLLNVYKVAAEMSNGVELIS